MKFNSNLKYVELHNHLDGSISPETIERICSRKFFDMPCGNSSSLRSFLQIKIDEPVTLREFLKKFEVVLPIIKGDTEAIAEICHDFVKMAAESQICYTEARFCPECLSSDSLSVEAVLKTVLESFKLAEKHYGVVTRTILSTLRHVDLTSPTCLDLAIAYKPHGVVGIDLAGDEQYSMDRNGTESKIIKMFQQAKHEGIHRTVHAGENGSVLLIREAINDLHAERIGHGYHILDDLNYYEEVRSKNIHFEICPTSSYLTRSVDKNFKLHPFHKFSDDKLNYSINCDDMMITGYNLLGEYQFCKDKFNMSDAEIIRTNLNAANATFLDDKDKQYLLEHLDKVFKN